MIVPRSPDLAAGTDILNLQPHEIAASELAIDGEIEQREIARAVLQLEPHPDRPYVFGLQRALLTNEARSSSLSWASVSGASSDPGSTVSR
jgi:hypothetical protein